MAQNMDLRLNRRRATIINQDLGTNVAIRHRSLPFKSFVTLNLANKDRYGMFTVGGFKNKDALNYTVRVGGGQITFSPTDLSGVVDIWRVPIYSFERPADNANLNTQISFDTYMNAFNQVISNTVQGLASFISDNILGVYVDEFGRELAYDWNFQDFTRIMIESKHKLEEWWVLETWSPVIQTIIETFPRNTLTSGGAGGERHERFTLWSFINPTPSDPVTSSEVMHGKIILEDNSECLLTPPSDTFAVTSRSMVNRTIWCWFCQYFGYSWKGAAMLWEEFSTKYVNPDKMITVEDFLALVQQESSSPVGFINSFHLEDVVVDEPLRHLIESLFIMSFKALWLKLFQVLNGILTEKDWKYQSKYTLFKKSMPDSQFNALLKIISDTWNLDEVMIPDGSLATKRTINILPITTAQSGGYLALPRWNDERGQYNHDSSEYNGRPAIAMVEVQFHLIMTENANHEFSTLQRNQADMESVSANVVPLLCQNYRWIEIRTLNVSSESLLYGLNTVTGDIQATSLEGEGHFRFDVVYPSDIKMIKPVSISMNFEQRHWPLVFDRLTDPIKMIYCYNYMQAVLYGQQKIYGPHSYLLDDRSLFKDGKYDALYDDNYYPEAKEKKVLELDKLIAVPTVGASDYISVFGRMQPWIVNLRDKVIVDAKKVIEKIKNEMELYLKQMYPTRELKSLNIKVKANKRRGK